MTINDIKQTIGSNTEKVEKQAKEYWNKLAPNYSNLEPWQRGLILLGLVGLTTLTIYLLTKEDKSERKKAKQEAMMEERLLRKMELLKKLKE